MRRSELAGSDRFFDNHWKCSCGRTAILDTPQSTPGVGKGGEPPGSIGAGAETSRENTYSKAQEAGRTILCERCGQSMRPIAIPDRFFADYWECGGCGRAAPLHRLLAATEQERAVNQEVCKPGPAQPKRPKLNSNVYRKDPNFEQVQTVSDAVVQEPPGDSVVARGRGPLPLLWGRSYLVDVESKDPSARLGLPQVWSVTEVRAGDKTHHCLEPDYPVGFHVALRKGSSPSKALPHLRLAVVWLYEKLLERRDLETVAVRRHLLAPVAALCRVAPLKTGLDSTPFQILLAQDHFPYEVLYLQGFLQELLDKKMIPTTGRLLSLRALGTKPGVIATKDLKLEDDEIQTLKQFFGPYRFADK